MKFRLAVVNSRLNALAAQLAQLSPLAILERGYAIVQDAEGRLIKQSSQAPVDSMLSVRLGNGRLGVKVTDSIPE